MGFSRDVAPRVLPDGKALGRAMAGVGMTVAAEPDYGVPIEDTLLAVSIAGMQHDQLRELALLTAWWTVHATFVNADRLFEVIKREGSERLRSYWSALAASRRTDLRFRRYAILAPSTEQHLLLVGSAFQLSRRGEDVRFVGSKLKVPEGVLRDRVSDVLPPERLAAHHPTYRARILMGPSYRADMWAVLEREPTLTLSELARRTYGSIATASRVKRDYELWIKARPRGVASR